LEAKDRILKAAQDLFHKYGIRSITMDDIARHLGMSKKTIYRFFRDKDSLVLHKVMYDLESRREEIDSIHGQAENAVDELIRAMSYMSEMFRQMNPVVFYDMQKYHPTAWEQFRIFKEKHIMSMIERNLNRGIKESLYRKEIDIRVISRLRLEEVEMAMKMDVFPPGEFNIAEVQVQLLDHFLHGITTLKGHRLINKYKQLSEEE
jgi:TetR/AcrR family transcriptional regulator, cholesterol catabolism regulator